MIMNLTTPTRQYLKNVMMIFPFNQAVKPVAISNQPTLVWIMLTWQTKINEWYGKKLPPPRTDSENKLCTPSWGHHRAWFLRGYPHKLQLMFPLVAGPIMSVESSWQAVNWCQGRPRTVSVQCPKSLTTACLDVPKEHLVGDIFPPIWGSQGKASKHTVSGWKNRCIRARWVLAEITMVAVISSCLPCLLLIANPCAYPWMPTVFVGICDCNFCYGYTWLKLQSKWFP